ncbi:MAG TPA: flagellar protein FlaG [Firmicutes bacterium]|nr:flagellar protein FlaG [Bacillota bacterium]
MQVMPVKANVVAGGATLDGASAAGLEVNGPRNVGQAPAEKGAGTGLSTGTGDVQGATEALNKLAQTFSAHLSFVLHEESGRMQVRVIDNHTMEVVKEIPPTEVLEVVANIRKMIGILLDKKV